jgi:hypothetical protein
MARIANKAGAGEAHSGNRRSGCADGVVLIHALARSAPARRLLGPVLTQVAAFPGNEPRNVQIGSIAGTGHIGWLNAPLGLDGPNDGLVTIRSAGGGAGARAAVPVSHTFLPMSARVARLVEGFLRDGGFDGVQECEQ